MIPVATWLLYAVPAYLLYPVFFQVRYGFSPWVTRAIPRTRYEATDVFLAVVLIGYSIWLVVPWLLSGAKAGVEVADFGVATWAGLSLWALGALLRISALWALGRHWRIGQDERDSGHEFVRRGVYRLLRHPINLALIVVALGQTMLTGFTLGSWVLLGGAIVYAVVQNANENRYWRLRSNAGTPKG